MPFDLLTLFEETETALTRWDEGDESAAEAFAKRILSLRPAHVSGTGYMLYQPRGCRCPVYPVDIEHEPRTWSCSLCRGALSIF